MENTKIEVSSVSQVSGGKKQTYVQLLKTNENQKTDTRLVITPDQAKELIRDLQTILIQD